MSSHEEHSRDEQPLDNELRELWAKVAPRTGLGEELEREDALTRASVSLLQEAWSSIAVPAPLANKTLVSRPPLQTSSMALARRQWFALAAAAALLLAAALGLRASAKTLRSQGIDLAQRNLNDDAKSLVIEQHTANNTAPENSNPSSSGESSPLSTGHDVQVEVTDDERLVLKSGPVRLYLAANLPPSNHPITNSFDTQATETSP